MALTGSVFLGAVLVVTVAAFVVLVLRWPSLAGHTAGKIAARVGMLLVVNVLVLLTAATQLNAQFLFFADWTDLKGSFTGVISATTLNRGISAAQAASRDVSGPAATAGRALPPLPTGRVSPAGVITYTVKGPMSGIVGTVLVQLPPGYTHPGNASVRYPVLEAFHGYPGDPRLWTSTDGMDLGRIAAQQASAKRMRPALIVSPQVEIPAGADTECVNGSIGNPQVETWLTRDVPNWVARTFRVQTNREAWAAIGLSAGGYCAAMAALLHPAQFGAAIVMGGYFRPEFGPYDVPYLPGDPLAARYDLVALSKNKPPPVAVWLETSHADPVSYLSSAAFLKAARSPLAVNATVLQNAGHRLSLWRGLLPGSLSWLGANLAGFKVTG